MRNLLQHRTDRSRGDEGVAIILVVSVAFIVTMLMVTLISYTVLSVAHARKEQDYQASLSAAQAGVDDYLSRLNANNVYWQTADCGNGAMSKPTTGANACGWNSSTPVGWLPIAGAATPTGGTCSAIPTPPSCTVYHYDVDSSGTIANGVIAVTATGKSRKVTRSIRVSVRRQSFGDFLYYTDYETIDPANPLQYGSNNTTAETLCHRHYWDSPRRDTSYCPDITFITGDTVNGPLHSNDAILISGTPRFNGPVTTAYPNCKLAPPASDCYRSGGGGTNPSFAKGISFVPFLPMPASNLTLQAQTVTSTAVGTPGCGYTGPTRIHFYSNGTMDVWSPYTQTVNAGCGSAPFTGAAQRLTVPLNNVIFVAAVPSGQANPPSGDCVPGSIGNYPQANDVNYDYEYDCREGTIFIDGALSGRVTVSAANNIIVTDNLTYANGSAGADSLGLIAAGSVEVYHPISCTRRSGSVCTTGSNMNGIDGTTFRDPVIQAAILSLTHSFGVQLHSLGTSLGTLNVFGSIGQLYRGPVGTGSGTTGYLKSYVYDTRLKFAPPPFYLNPVQAKYIAAVFADVAPAY